MKIINSLAASLAALSSLVLLTSCPMTMMVEPADAPSQRDQVIYAPLAAPVAQSSEQAIAAFGIPLEETKQSLSTLHDAQQNQWLELKYSDLHLGYFIDPQSGKEILAYQRIASARYPLKGNLRIGQSLADFEAVLGKANQITDTQADFCDRWGRGDCIQLSLKGPQVIALEQVFAMD